MKQILCLLCLISPLWARTYSTNFPLTENPISESGNWTNGLAVGLDWGDVQTTTNLAFGTNTCAGPPYCDSSAIVNGSWGATNQTACATVFLSGSLSRNAAFYEVELRLHTSISAHSITGYEFNYSMKTSGQYAQIVRWNGALNNFTILASASSPPAIANGDILCAEARGNTLTWYRNGSSLVSTSDSTYAGGGNIGVGFYNQGGSTGDNQYYGFSQFAASDGAPKACPASSPVTGNSSCYFTSAYGSDTSDGLTEASAWLHAPGMPNCSSACATEQTALGSYGTKNAGVGFIFRGGDTWHFGASTSPATGGTWTPQWDGDQTTCVYEGTLTGCFYIGVDTTWFVGGSWTRPILNGDNATSTTITSAAISTITVSGATTTVNSTLAGCTNGQIVRVGNQANSAVTSPCTGSSFQVNTAGFNGNNISACGSSCGTAQMHGVASCAHLAGASNTLLNISTSPYQYWDSFELTGLCTDTSETGAYVINNGLDQPPNTPMMTFWVNSYFHGWTVTNATQGNSGQSMQCTVFQGGSLQSWIHDVVDGSDSDPGTCSVGTFPDIQYMVGNIFRYATQLVVNWTHDEHDNIWEYFYTPYMFTHGNAFEANTDGKGNAQGQPANTPNVFYNNIMRHFDPSMGLNGQVDLWKCPTTVPEYWFNNLIYDLNPSAGQGSWDIAGPPGYSCLSDGTGSGPAQFMFNNTLVDTVQPCRLGPNTGGSIYLTIVNEHLINSPLDGAGNPNCTGYNSATNIAQTDAVATGQGYTTGTSGTSFTNTCANDSTTPCSPTSAGNATVGAGSNEQGYCTALAAFSSDPPIGTDAANACKYGTTDGCAYNASSHAMSCPAQTAVVRPLSAAWDSGAYEFMAGPASNGSVFSGASLTGFKFQ